jgi:hypothetical protein
VGERDVPTTRRVWPRGTVRFTSRDASHDRRCLEDVGLAWVDETRPVIVYPSQRGTRVYPPDGSRPTRDAYHACQGYLDRRSRVPLKRLRISYPHVQVVAIDRRFFQPCEAQGLCRLIAGCARRHYPERL